MSTIASSLARPSRLRAFLGRAFRKPAFVAGFAILVLSLALAILPQVLAPYDPLAFDLEAIQQGPSLAHPFGTDNFGRDMLSRVIWAYSVDMQMAFFATIFALIIGVTVGALVGYYGGIADMIFGRCVDAISADVTTAVVSETVVMPKIMTMTATSFENGVCGMTSP